MVSRVKASAKEGCHARAMLCYGGLRLDNNSCSPRLGYVNQGWLMNNSHVSETSTGSEQVLVRAEEDKTEPNQEVGIFSKVYPINQVETC
jgi:hypothetical protein